MDAALAVMLTASLLHEAYQGQDSYGAPTFTPGISRAARVDYVARRFTTSTGQEAVSRAIAYLDWPAGMRFGLRDRYTLPDGLQPQAQRIDHWTDETGAQDHACVFF